MKTHKNLYKKLCSFDNLLFAFQKARKGKSNKPYVINFEKNLEKNLRVLQEDLINKTYNPSNLSKFVIRDPKTRIIHASIFRDRVVHHAIVNILNPIYEKIFIYDSFASRKNKGSHKAVERFESFVRKVSSNGQLTKNSFNNNSIQGYALKADFRKYFDSVNHQVLIRVLRKKINDEDILWLVEVILSNFKTAQDTGMPLGNYTSQFFANIYLNELDYYMKHVLNAKHYIRYVDDFVILHKNKKRLAYFLEKIKNFLPSLKIKLHQDKTQIMPLCKGVTFLGYRVFFHNRLLRERNLNYFKNRLRNNLALLDEEKITQERFSSAVKGWEGYAKFANTWNLRNKLLANVSVSE
jgi:retron-type reverse transcriptase